MLNETLKLLSPTTPSEGLVAGSAGGAATTVKASYEGLDKSMETTFVQYRVMAPSVSLHRQMHISVYVLMYNTSVRICERKKTGYVHMYIDIHTFYRCAYIHIYIYVQTQFSNACNNVSSHRMGGWTSVRLSGFRDGTFRGWGVRSV